MTDSLPRLPDEDFTRVLCVAAHPDDMEYGSSAAVATWTRRGVQVRYLLLTQGEAGMDNTEPARTAQIRTAEQEAACRAVGVERVDLLHHPDGTLVYGLDLRRDVAAAIRDFRPDVVVTGSWEVEFIPGMLNQADHRVAGLATLDAIRDAGNRWVFTDQLTDGAEPHSVRWLLVAGDPRPTHGVEVDEAALEAAVASLEAHAAYLASIPWHPTARELVTMITGMMGKRLGAERGVLFRAYDFEAPPAFPEE
jgi:LmbE family N-acetylglucosaminyl deacetylase